MVRVRLAPSPTGYMHIGNLRTAVYNQLLALRHGGTFILRIEDTDQSRLVEGAVESLLRTMARCGLTPTEGPYLDDAGQLQERGDFGPYTQSLRLPIYREHAEKLLQAGNAYYCFCTSERLEEMKALQAASKLPVMYDKLCRQLPADEVKAQLDAHKPHVIRMKMPSEGFTTFTDSVRGDMKFENVLIDDQVLMKSDGFPTYHLAVIVDDHLMGITHVLRGEEWLPSTPKHIMLYKMFGWEPTQFAHLPLLLNADRSKLSKRQGDVAVEDYLNKGYLPEALINFVALLGWNPTADRDVYTKDELASMFDLNKVNQAGAVFNREKLDWFNKEYLKSMTPAAVAAAAKQYFDKAGFRAEDALIEKAVALEQRRVTTLAEFPEATRYLFEEIGAINVAILPGKKGTIDTARERLAGLRDYLSGVGEDVFADPKKLEEPLLALIKDKGWSNADTLWPMRVALTGREQSPSPFEVAWALGRERTLQRIAAALTALG